MSGGAELADLIAKAREHDEAARKARLAAGLVLLRAGSAANRFQLAQAAGIDPRLVDLLVGMTTGSASRKG